MKRVFLLWFMVLHSLFIAAQRPSTEHFSQYYPTNGINGPNSQVIMAPGTLGPNALPIPEVTSAQIGTDLHFKLTNEHYSRQGGGDDGQTLSLNIQFPVVQDFMAFEFSWRFIDYFHETNEIRDLYQIYKDDPGWTSTAGDIILNTYIQISLEKKYMPAIMLVSSMKTASGSLEDGRYTDLPAYWFLGNLGKTAYQTEHFKWQLHSITGHYIWQTNETDLGQDEGFIWGLSNYLSYKQFALATGISGINGYKWHGEDHPRIIDCKLTCQSTTLNCFIQYKKGIRNYYYRFINLGFDFHPTSPFKLKN